MLGLHIAMMCYECKESPFVTEDHKFDLNLMVWTRGFTHCHELLRLMARMSGESSRIITHSHEYCPVLLQFTKRHCELLCSITCHECYQSRDVENCSYIKELVCI